ncbi:hypothetical protein [Paraflavitalea speifideaquila]|uniref:hypothetical protein n=1 Tax=Paraflavitalea speifideaquila TaxID=3076558 RepID=UPI0028E272DF|nr:hypothetical protein [Paraflavitalea speifideiaquila]
MKGIYGICHKVSVSTYKVYCDEFKARYNTRDIKDHERFEWTIQQSNGRLKYNQPIGKED